MTQSAISHQLRILKQMKLVKKQKGRKTVFYSLADGHIKTIINQGMEHIQSNKKKSRRAGKPANRRKPTNKGEADEQGKS